MNGSDAYERHLDRIPDDAPPGAPGQEVSPLAVRRDPSQPAQPVEAATGSSRGVAWVRPTELATTIGARVAGRGIDLQTALAERARRAPAAIVRASRRTTRTTTRPTVTRPHTAAPEGLGL